MDKNDDGDFQNLPGYMSVKEAAQFLKLSIRRVHEYVQNGKLHAFKAGGHMLMLKEEDVENFQRSRIGRPRTRLPIWRIPVGENLQYLTIIFVRLRAGQREKIHQKLEEIRSGEKHLLPGTVARYIAYDEEQPDDLQMVLVWRSTVMPPLEQREAALTALREELAEVVDWETARSKSGKVLMHT